MPVSAPQEPSENEYIDDEGNLCRVYAIEDEPHLVASQQPQLLWVKSKTQLERGSLMTKTRVCQV